MLLHAVAAAAGAADDDAKCMYGVNDANRTLLVMSRAHVIWQY